MFSFTFQQVFFFGLVAFDFRPMAAVFEERGPAYVSPGPNCDRESLLSMKLNRI